MTKRILGALAALLLTCAPVLAGGSAIAPPSSGGGSPSGAAGGSLGGSYPNPSLNITSGPCASGQLLTQQVSLGPLVCVTPSGTTTGFGYGSGSSVSGKYYGFFGESYVGGSTLPAGTARCHAITPTRTTTFKALAASVTTIAAGGNFQLALYNANADGSAATTRIDYTGNISTAGNSGVAGPIAGALTLGTPTLQANTLYALCAESDNSSAILLAASTSVVQISGVTNVLNAPKSATSGYGGFTYSLGFGSWPPDLSSSAGYTASEYAAPTPAAFGQAN